MPFIHPLAILVVTGLLPSGNHAGQQDPVTLGPPDLLIGHEFSELAAVAELRSGHLVVADSRDHLLYLVDPGGGRVDPLGRKGRGPGEYQNAWGLVRMPGDTILVYDPRNNQFLRIDPEGRVAGGIPISAAARAGGLSPPRGADAQGRLYWDRVVVQNEGAAGMKRRQTVDLVRWRPGTDQVDTLGRAADHAPEMHHHRFHPFPERDAWVVSPDGRVGIVVAASYRLRWIAAGSAEPREGPALDQNRVPVTRSDREGFRTEQAIRPAGGAQLQGPGQGTGTPVTPETRRRIEASWPDEIFPRFKPPFEERGAWLAPNGAVWVARTRAAGETAQVVDVLGQDGRLQRRVRLPAGRRIVGLERGGIYLARADADGLEYLERHPWPPGWR